MLCLCQNILNFPLEIKVIANRQLLFLSRDLIFFGAKIASKFEEEQARITFDATCPIIFPHRHFVKS